MPVRGSALNKRLTVKKDTTLKVKSHPMKWDRRRTPKPLVRGLDQYVSGFPKGTKGR